MTTTEPGRDRRGIKPLSMKLRLGLIIPVVFPWLFPAFIFGVMRMLDRDPGALIFLFPLAAFTLALSAVATKHRTYFWTAFVALVLLTAFSFTGFWKVLSVVGDMH